MKASLEKVRTSLSPSRRNEFDKAATTVMMNEFSFSDLLHGSIGAENLQNKAKDALNGKTADEVIAAAQQIQREQHDKEQLQLIQEIKELETKLLKCENSKKELARFKVLRSRFYKEKTFMGDSPVIELTVRNETQHAVSKAYFIGTLASPHRSIPWMKDTFNYEIAGGLEPGEQATWKLAPNMFSNWGKTEAPNDALFTVEVVQLNGVGDKLIASSQGFGAEEAARLEKLRAQASNYQ